jgi:septum formation protein
MRLNEDEPRIILASQSPRRKMLLEWAEVSFEIIVEPTDETFPAELASEDAAIHIARNKAKAVRENKLKQSQAGRAVVIAADTIVVLANEIIGKPVDRDDAISILRKLSGKRHEVITGVVIDDGTKAVEFFDVTEVSFYELSEEQIAYYVDKYRPYDKAGAYAIQEWIGVTGIKSINGDFYNVMGLPVSRVVKALQSYR